MRPEPEDESHAAFQRIAPQPPKLRTEAAPETAARGDTGRIPASRFVLGLLLLLLAGGAALWGLPRLLSTSPPAPRASTPAPSSVPAGDPPPAAADAAGTVRPATAAAATSVEAWDDPELLQARASAQDARSAYAADLATLQTLDAGNWAGAELAAASAEAASGTQAFDAGDYAAADRAWQAAADALRELVDSVPQRLQSALQTGEAALQAGRLQDASAAFELALKLQAGHADALRGLQRVANHDQVRARLDTAFRLQQAGDLPGARAAVREALALDSLDREAAQALSRLDAGIAAQAFSLHLAQALQALDAGQLDTAAAALARARGLRAQDPALAGPTERLAQARREQQIRSLRQQAQAAVVDENWAAAVDGYLKALQLDASLVFADQGLQTARPRAELDARLQALIDQPQRLHSAAVLAEAEAVLAQARRIDVAGPRLREQIAALEQARDAAAQPVMVELVSDGQTQVTLYRVGSLGRFMQHQTRLRPGRYVALGSRPGYIDVRREFEVAAGGGPTRVEIRCTEAL